MDMSKPSKRQKLSDQTRQTFSQASPAAGSSFWLDGRLGDSNLAQSDSPALLPVSSLPHISQLVNFSLPQSLSSATSPSSTELSCFLTAPSISVNSQNHEIQQAQILAFASQTHREFAASPPAWNSEHDTEEATDPGYPPVPVHPSSSETLSQKDCRAPKEKVVIDLTSSPLIPPIPSHASPSSPYLRHLFLHQDEQDSHNAKSVDPSRCLALKLQAQFDNEENQVIADFHLSHHLMQNQDIAWDARFAKELQAQFDQESEQGELWASLEYSLDRSHAPNRESAAPQGSLHEAAALPTRTGGDGLSDFHIPRQAMVVSSLQSSLPDFVNARCSMLCSICSSPLLDSAESIIEHIKFIKSSGKQTPRVDGALQCKACEAYTCLGCGKHSSSKVAPLTHDGCAPKSTSCCEQWRLSLIWLSLWVWELQLQSQNQPQSQIQSRPTKGRHRSQEGAPKKKSASRRSQRPDGVGYGGPEPRPVPLEYLMLGTPIHPATSHLPTTQKAIPQASDVQSTAKSMELPSSHSGVPSAFQATSGGPSSDHGLHSKYQSLFNKHKAQHQSLLSNYQGAHSMGNVTSLQTRLPPEYYSGSIGTFPMVQPYANLGYHSGGMSNPPMMQPQSNLGSYSGAQRNASHDSSGHSGHSHLHPSSQPVKGSLPTLPADSSLSNSHLKVNKAVSEQSTQKDDLLKLQNQPALKRYGAGPAKVPSAASFFGMNGHLANYSSMQPDYSLPPYAITQPMHPNQIQAADTASLLNYTSPHASKGDDQAKYKPKKPLMQLAHDIFDNVAKTISKPPLSPRRVKEESAAAARDQEILEIFGLLCELLPRADNDASLFDIAPPPELLSMLALSSVLDEVAELLRNDSVVDATKRQALYHGLIKLVIQLVSHDGTCDVILKDRPQKALRLSRFEQSKGTRKDLGDTDHVSSVAASMKNIVKQSRIVLRNSRNETSQVLGDDARDMLLLCNRIVDMAEIVSRRSLHLSREAVSGPPMTRSNSKADKAQEWQDWQKTNCMLDVPDEVILKTHKYAGDATAVTQCPRGRMKRLIEESATLSTSLPPGIFVRYASSRPDVLKVLIIGPSGTPYEGGLFEFDAWCPKNYPHEPPRFTFKTTGAGRSRFNPNLYECGKVCLSILNTWPGETWKPNESTLLQVLVSLQSMVFCEQPFYNEPGHEARENAKASELYDKRIKGLTMRLAMTAWLQHGRQTIWAQVIQEHFQRNRQEILQLARRWANEGAANEAGELQQALGEGC